MPQKEVWLRDYPITGNSGGGTENDPFDASTADLFDALMHGFHDQSDFPPYYIHLGTGLFKTNGGLINVGTQAAPVYKGWLMWNGWTIVGAGVGAITLRLNEFTAIP